MTLSKFRSDENLASDYELPPKSEQPENAKNLLEQPSHFLAVLADAIREEIAFYSHDMDGRFVYLSRSAGQVLNHDPRYWIGRAFADVLTESPCNEHITSDSWKTPTEGTGNSRVCEIFDQDGKRLKLQHWRTHILHGGKPIGVSGIVRRLKCQEETKTTGADEVLAKAQLLTDVERQVIELVIDGNMNKTIAGMLDVAVRTVESRRSRAMVKLQVKSLSELVQLWMKVRQAEGTSTETGVTP